MANSPRSRKSSDAKGNSSQSKKSQPTVDPILSPASEEETGVDTSPSLSSEPSIVVEAPVAEELLIEEPSIVVEAPIAEELLIEEPSVVVEAPVLIEEPSIVVEAPVAEELLIEEPSIVVEAPIAEELLIEEPSVVVEAPVLIEEPSIVVEAPVAEELLIEEPSIVVEAPVLIEEPSIVVEAPVAEELLIEEPPVVVEAPVLIEEPSIVVEAPVLIEEPSIVVEAPVLIEEPPVAEAPAPVPVAEETPVALEEPTPEPIVEQTIADEPPVVEEEPTPQPLVEDQPKWVNTLATEILFNAEPTSASKVEVVIDSPTTFSYDSVNQSIQPMKEEILAFLSELPENLGSFFKDYKRPLTTVGLIIAFLITFKILGGLVEIINEIPLIKPTFETVGLGYSAWFIYRYLLKADNRKELSADFNTLKEEILGKKS